MAYSSSRAYLNRTDDDRWLWSSNAIGTHIGSNAAMAATLSATSAKAIATSNVTYPAITSLVGTSNLLGANISKTLATSNVTYSNNIILATTSNVTYSNNTSLLNTMLTTACNVALLSTLSNCLYTLSIPDFPVGHVTQCAFSNVAPTNYAYAHGQTFDSNTYPTLYATYSNTGLVPSNDLFFLPSDSTLSNVYMHVKYE
jgi:hypothetical protein